MNEVFYNYVSRLNPGIPPNIPLPFYLHAAGRFRVSDKQSEKVPAGEKNFVELFWGIAGNGVFLMENGEQGVMHPGDFFYRLPGEAHFQHAQTPFWEYCWLTFDGPLAETFMRSYEYARAPFHAGECPKELFSRAGDLLREMEPNSWHEGVALVTGLLARAGGRGDASVKEGLIASRISAICREGFRNPSLDINAIAGELGIDRSSVRRIFARKMRMNPSEYLIRLRVQHAISLLQNTVSPISEVARLSGFNDFSYFCKTIRIHTGRRPSSFRTSPFFPRAK